MRDHYDFASMKGTKNPYLKQLKKSVTMRLDCESIEYFKALAEENNIPYQTIINMYLRDCVTNKRKLDISWN